jgi:hypothetical protein
MKTRTINKNVIRFSILKFWIDQISQSADHNLMIEAVDFRSAKIDKIALSYINANGEEVFQVHGYQVMQCQDAMAPQPVMTQGYKN